MGGIRGPGRVKYYLGNKFLGVRPSNFERGGFCKEVYIVGEEHNEKVPFPAFSTVGGEIGGIQMEGKEGKSFSFHLKNKRRIGQGDAR